MRRSAELSADVPASHWVRVTLDCHHDAETGYAIDAHPACTAGGRPFCAETDAPSHHLATWPPCITRLRGRLPANTHRLSRARTRPSTRRPPDHRRQASATTVLPIPAGLMRWQRSVQRRKLKAIATTTSRAHLNCAIAPQKVVSLPHKRHYNRCTNFGVLHWVTVRADGVCGARGIENEGTR